ncbi:rhamnulokinase [bacterium]|nr:rhamnulokinase [bacterium]
MSSQKYIAADFGASSGRIMLAEIDRSIRLKEIHRFPNHQILNLGHYQWDLLGLFHELKTGLSKITNAGHREIAGIGVDTWGVDFGFVGRNNVILCNPYCYRDSRSQGMMEIAFEKFSRTEIYSATGIQFMALNSVYQLLSMVESGHPVLDAAESLLFMPDLFHFLMTGERRSEYSIASTSQLLNAQARQWDALIFEKLNLPRHLMAEIVDSGTVIGNLRQEIREETGLTIKRVIAPASHDTAAAVAAVPASDKNSWAYLSSGTWSLLGVELQAPLINADTLERNYTNEGGVRSTIRFLKNVTGMWLVEECRRKWQKDGDISYESLLNEADQSPPFQSLLNVDNPDFMNPPDMVKAIQAFCRRSNQPVPETRGQFIRSILESLALRYRQVIEDINHLQGKPVEILHVVGGGSQNAMLNQFTADATGIPVIAGPVEATALGNVITQAVAAGQLDSIEQGRALIARAFPMQEFLPQKTERWDEASHRYQDIFDK